LKLTETEIDVKPDDEVPICCLFREEDKQTGADDKANILLKICLVQIPEKCAKTERGRKLH